ncbi:MAG: FAD-binding oxidoreductase [Candidatus Caldarchaeum sp.]|nr:FAD-binding oxidoreductase [Candidatus Caldarchaeum sp.]MDW8360017.1 FAD-dependent oxidoreductase [Candidatus Caldarchaeum sp.]
MRFDVVVVGGGSTGASIAYHLVKQGAGKVALVEKDYVGWGQTGRSTAVVRLHYSTPEVASMALASWRVLKNMEKEVGGPSGFTACGFLLLAGEEELQGLERNVAMLKKVGVETRIIAADEVREVEPRIDTTGLAAAAYEPESGYADPVATAQTYARAAAADGCVLMEACEVVSVRMEGRRIERLITSRGEFEADLVVNATGVWCNTFLEKVGEELPVKVMKEEIVVWSRPETFRGQHPVVGDLPNNYYMRPFGETQTYMGSINPDMNRQEKHPTAFNLNEKVGLDTASMYGEAVSKRFPAMAEARIAGGWVGLYDVTPDWHPIVDFSAQVENLFNVVGLSGHGFKLCPALGMLTADILLKRRKPLINPDFFSRERFERRRLIGMSYKYGVIS